MSQPLGDQMVNKCLETSKGIPPREQIVAVVEDIEKSVYELISSGNEQLSRQSLADTMAGRRKYHDPVAFEYVANLWAEMYDKKLDRISQYLRFARRKV